MVIARGTKEERKRVISNKRIKEEMKAREEKNLSEWWMTRQQLVRLIFLANQLS